MNKRLLSTISTICLALFVSLPVLQAQNFIKYYNASFSLGSNNVDVFYDVEMLASGNYVCTGYSRGPGIPRANVVVYSPTGQVLLDWRYAGPNTQYGYSVAPTADGGFLVAGYDVGTVATPLNGILLTRFNAQGDSVWSKKHSAITAQNLVPLAALDVIETNDGGFILACRAGVPPSAPQSQWEGYILRVDSRGDFVWSNVFSASGQDEAKGVIETSDGGFLVTGYTNSYSGNGNFAPFAVKLNVNGAKEWEKVYTAHAAVASTSLRAVEHTPGVYVLAFGEIVGAASVPTGKLLTINATGDSINSHSFGTEAYSNIRQTADGGYILAGFTGLGTAGSTTPSDLILVKLDNQFNQQFRRVIAGAPAAYGFGVLQAPDGGYLVSGQWYREAILIKTDPNGQVPTATVTGKVFGDLNNNCIQDGNEVPLPNHMVEVVATSSNYYGYTNAQGEYTITVYDTGSVVLNWSTPNTYWSPSTCQANGITLTLIQSGTLTQNFYAQPKALCADLVVTLINPFIRRCFPTTYYLQYCNRGTLSAANSYIEVDLDPDMIVTGASIPWASPQTGNRYRFDVGNLDIGDCGTFTIEAITDCNNTVLGQTHCAVAQIFPHGRCFAPDTSWDSSCVSVTGECAPGDTVKFKIENTGTGDMAAPSNYIIVEDNVMYANGQFQLNAGQFNTYNIKGNGSTFTMIAEQVPGYPGRSHPIFYIEGCGFNDQGTFTVGFVPQFPQDDQDPFISTLCLENIGSYDPNDKRPEPLGLGSEGYINATQPLDYTIRFQNTGTDTAFTVVIRDTLAATLDVASLQLTGASHNYTFQIIGSNILEWRFANILLPDSNVNEPASHGFVSFYIEQASGNAPGTEIRNHAGIFFDFNPPVITNATLNTVVEDYKNEIIISIEELSNKDNNLKLYPNPNTGQFYVEFLQPVEGNVSLMIFDLTGKEVYQSTFEGMGQPQLINIEGLQTGLYFYKLTLGSENLNTGKLLIQRN